MVVSKIDFWQLRLYISQDRFHWPKHRRNPNQIWILFLLECPLHTQSFKGLNNIFNWTATYRHESDIVAPYEKYVRYPDIDQVIELF